MFKSERAAYENARVRCTNPANAGYAFYGGRGILFQFDSFDQFISHIGPKPSPELTLDHIENAGHYAVGNVRWATRKQQANNRRPRGPETKQRKSKGVRKYQPISAIALASLVHYY
jgi:hypothetical protein